MTRAGKVKVSVTLSADLLERIDREARRRRSTRSGVMELHLRAGAATAAERQLEEATAAYYAGLRLEERAEAEAIARGSAAASRQVAFDVRQTRVRRR